MSTSTSEQKNVHAPKHVSDQVYQKATPADHRVQVAAARLRVTLDARLGRETPARTKALAKEEI